MAEEVEPTESQNVEIVELSKCAQLDIFELLEPTLLKPHLQIRPICQLIERNAARSVEKAQPAVAAVSVKPAMWGQIAPEMAERLT